MKSHLHTFRKLFCLFYFIVGNGLHNYGVCAEERMVNPESLEYNQEKDPIP
jgi:hypothetical protein